MCSELATCHCCQLMIKLNMSETGSHFVLVHGACHGAWCWFKVMDLLRKSGHRATAIDLAASGRHAADPDSITSFRDYNQPLSDFLSSLSPLERSKVILVGHSLGGISISHASEEFPGQLAALVFVAGPILPSLFSYEEHFARVFRHCSLEFFHKLGPDEYPTSFIFRPESLAESFYSRSPSEDIVLASLLLRPNPVAAQLAPKLDITDEGFKVIPKMYIKTGLDNAFSEASQERVAREHDIQDIVTIQADHSPFFSAPKDLVTHLLSAHNKYAASGRAEGKGP